MPKNDHLIRFSVFELDRDSGELFKQGRKVKLQGQPFELLVALLERPGQAVTREELRQTVWPSDTAGDFDHGLNRAVNKVREALGDSAETPRFIETLPRRGYRFIGSIQEENHAQLAPVEPLADQAPPSAGEAKHRPRRRAWLIAIAAGGVAVGTAIFVTWWMTHRPSVPPPDLKLRQLTTNSFENRVTEAVISPDGKYLAYGDLTGIRLQEISTGQTYALPRPKAVSQDAAWFPSAWFPDGSRIVASAIRATPDGQIINSAWSVPVLGSNPVLLRDDAIAPSVSPDGSLIAFTRDIVFLDEDLDEIFVPWTREIWVMGPNGENARKLIPNDGKTIFRRVQWSPDSSRIACLEHRTDSKAPYSADIEAIALKSGRAAVILPALLRTEFRWVPDGRIIYDQYENHRDANLWELKVDSKSGKPQGRPHRITNLPGFGMGQLNVSSDGKKLTFQKTSDRAEVYIGRLQPGGRLEGPRRLTSDERWNMPFAWTPDSKSVIFISDRTGALAIYRQAIDQDLAELIPTGPGRVWASRVTPDGSSIVYFANGPSAASRVEEAIRIMRVPISGGPRELVMEFPPSGDINLDCPIRANAQCVVEDRPAGMNVNQAKFIAFDPLTGKRRELFRGIGGLHWALSPDGARIGRIRGNNIEILSLAGQAEQTIQLKSWPYLQSIDWTADGKALLVPHEAPTGMTLLRVGLDGHVQPLWAARYCVYSWTIASPDGHYLAIMGTSLDSNAWLLENF
jgi:DNA-binding winged helix-turn-helix (wHTH) protein/Tol biopolymer transport system component